MLYHVVEREYTFRFALHLNFYHCYAKHVILMKLDISFSVGSDIEFRGSDSSNQIMLSKIMLILDGNNDTCMSLPTQSTTNTAKFYWTTVNSQTLGANGSVPFNLTIVGNGLQCNNTKGPQVTKVSE